MAYALPLCFLSRVIIIARQGIGMKGSTGFLHIKQLGKTADVKSTSDIIALCLNHILDVSEKFLNFAKTTTQH